MRGSKHLPSRSLAQIPGIWSFNPVGPVIQGSFHGRKVDVLGGIVSRRLRTRGPAMKWPARSMSHIHLPFADFQEGWRCGAAVGSRQMKKANARQRQCGETGNPHARTN